MTRSLLALLACVALAAAAPAWRALDRAAAYPEGPLARGAGVLVAEMGADRVSAYEDGGKSTFWSAGGCGPTALAPYGDGYAALCHLAGAVAILDRNGAAQRLIKGLGNPNDASADGRGGVYFSSPGPFTKDSTPQGRVLHLNAQGRVRVVHQGLWYPNGVHVDQASRRVYVSEHLARRVWRFAIGPDGALTDAAVFAEIDAIAPAAAEPRYREAGPDGLELAPNGDLVVALYGEGRLLQITPEGRLRRVIGAPGRYVTNIAFLPDGSAIVTAPIDNETPPFPGVVARLPATAFAIR